MVAFHPVVWMLDDEFKEVKYYYRNKEIIVVDSQGTYTDSDANIHGKEYSWNQGISEAINALLGQKLQLVFYNQYSYSPYSCFKNVVHGEDKNWRVIGSKIKFLWFIH
jgi:hypothetical protein